MSRGDDIRPPEARFDPRHDRVEPLWDRVDRNRAKLAATVVLFIVGAVLGIDAVVAVTGALLVVFATFTGQTAAAASSLADVILWVSLGALLLAGAWTAVALARSERWLRERLGATIVPKGELLPTKYALKDMSLAAGITPAPALYAMDTPNVNAFVFAASRRRPVVGITTGLAERLTVDEQRAVFANLIARLRSGDTIYATGVTALTRPLWYFRDRQLRRDAEQDSSRMLGTMPEDGPVPASDPDAAMGLAVLFVPAAAFVAVTEAVAFGSRRSQLRQAEVADAEGMLLLREPTAMLDALETCIRVNNYVPTAGPGFAQLFYCWTGDSTDDEEDPEWRRVIRLREVLGVEGRGQVRIAPNRPALQTGSTMPSASSETE